MSTAPEYIAEVDDTGRVLWVWYKPAGAPRSHPMKDFAEARGQLAIATCHGASCAAISSWIEERAASTELSEPSA